MKKILIGIGVVGLAAWLLTMKGGKRLSPWEKMVADVLNPNTVIGSNQRKYLDSVGLPHTRENLLSYVEWVKADPLKRDPEKYQAYNQKSEWSDDDVVIFNS